jgi:two-component system, cell cycle response regulator CpdR
MAKVLVVDDEEGIRALVARGISLDGHEVEMASDGAEALDIIQAGNGAFDLLLTDIRMPLMDGIALALAAKRDFPALTILLMTGYAEQRERARSLEHVVVDVLTKPFGIADLRAKVAETLKAVGKA